MQAHPLADLFPPMSAGDYAALKDSIATRGYNRAQPVLVYEKKILDGRHRWRACRELEIEPSTTEYHGDDPLGAVLAANLARRQLTESQVALIRVKAEQVRPQRGGDRRSEKFQTQSNAFEAQVGGGREILRAARAVRDHGTPELVRAVEGGRIAVSAAKDVAKLPERDQQRIALEADERIRRQLVKEAKARARKRTAEEAPKADDFALASPKTQGTWKGRAYYTVEQWKALSAAERKDLITAGFDARPQGMNAQTGDAIEWARWSHNTVTGCLHDCPYCYARDFAERIYPQKFIPTFHPCRLSAPAHESVPMDEAKQDESYRNIFANSMSDLFGQWVPRDWIDATVEMARRNPQWNFLTLTKFPQRATDFEFPDNWWMGTTVDAQARVTNAERAFEKIQCRTKWLSVEPLLEPLRFEQMDLFQWVVIGGASKSNRTPEWIPPFDWLVSLHGQARAAGCRIYHKTNLWLSDAMRLREFPWREPTEPKLPKPFRYLKGM